MSSIEMMWWQSDANSTAGISARASFWVETMTAAAPAIVEDMLVIARRVGGVGRHGDAARGHDREVGDQPFGAVLADQHDAVAGLEPDPLEAVGQRRDLPRRLGIADRLPRRRRAWPTGTACRPCSRARVRNMRDEVGEMLELLVRAVPPSYSPTLVPSLRGSAAPTQRPSVPFDRIGLEARRARRRPCGRARSARGSSPRARCPFRRYTVSPGE